MDKSKLEIRILKYQNYIKHNPEKPYGYYCLGQIYFETKDYEASKTEFLNALELDKNHIRARLGLIKYYLIEGKFMKASSLYSSFLKRNTEKHIYRSEIASFMTNDMKRKNILNVKINLFDRIYSYIVLKSLISKYRSDEQNIISLILLCMHFIAEDTDNPLSQEIIYKTVYEDGINNELRWKLVKKISRYKGYILDDKELADKFSNLPHKDISSSYADFIFSRALTSLDTVKIKKMIKTASANNIPISPQNMWKYVYFCHKKDLYDISVYNAVHDLIRSGWIDSIIYKTLKRLKEKNIVNSTRKEDDLMAMFGYKAN